MITNFSKYTYVWNKRTFIIISFLLFIGCDPMWYDKYSIDNKSDYELKLYYRLFDDTDTTINILPKEFKEFFLGGGGIGYAQDYKDEFLTTYFDSLTIIINDSMSINKNYLNREFWEYEETGKGGGIANYKLVVDNEDIKRKQ